MKDKREPIKLLMVMMYQMRENYKKVVKMIINMKLLLIKQF